MQVFLIVQDFFTQAQSEAIAGALLTMLLAFVPVFCAWCGRILWDIRHDQLARMRAEKEAKEREDAERATRATRATDAPVVEAREVPPVRTPDVVGLHDESAAGEEFRRLGTHGPL